MSLRHQLKVASSLVATLTETGRGIMGPAFPKQPALPLKLYDMEGSPFCRRVREVLTALNLDVEIYPCPKNGQRFRPLVKQQGGKEQFPYFIDENTGDQLFESTAIIAHLFKHYSETGEVPVQYQYKTNFPLVGITTSAVRAMRGIKADSSNTQREQPAQLLELWSFEGSPYSRLVRERLTELELPYKLHNVAKERWQDMGPAVFRLKPGKYEPIASGKRAVELPRMQNKMQVPYLKDPNTGKALFESQAILAYLDQQYG